MKVTINRDRCIGAGMCLSVAEHLFELDADLKAVLTTADPVESERSAIDAAVACCPTSAISVSED